MTAKGLLGLLSLGEVRARHPQRELGGMEGRSEASHNFSLFSLPGSTKNSTQWSTMRRAMWLCSDSSVHIVGLRVRNSTSLPAVGSRRNHVIYGICSVSPLCSLSPAGVRIPHLDPPSLRKTRKMWHPPSLLSPPTPFSVWQTCLRVPSSLITFSPCPCLPLSFSLNPSLLLLCISCFFIGRNCFLPTLESSPSSVLVSLLGPKRGKRK